MENNKLIKQSHETYSQIRNTLIIAQTKVTAIVNTAMVGAYWEIGEQIYLACDENGNWRNRIFVRWNMDR
jgi:hypothetical protein